MAQPRPKMNFALVNGQPIDNDELDLQPLDNIGSGNDSELDIQPLDESVKSNQLQPIQEEHSPLIEKLFTPIVDVSPEMRGHMTDYAQEHPVIGGIGNLLTDAVVGESSPLSLLLGGLGAGESVAAKLGLEGLSKVLKIPSRIAGAGMTGHGLYNAVNSDTTGGKIGGGIEALLGALATRGPKGSPIEATMPNEPLNSIESVKPLEFQAPQSGLPIYNTPQFGLKPSNENLPYPLNIIPNRLRPPSTNAIVFDALLPERFKRNEQGAALPLTTKVKEPSLQLNYDRDLEKLNSIFDDSNFKDLPTISDKIDLNSWKDRLSKLFTNETGSLNISPLRKTPKNPIKILPENVPSDLSQALTDALKTRKAQDISYSRERAQRIRKAMTVQTRGMNGIYERLGHLKGELPKEPFWALKNLRAETKREVLDEIFNSDKLKDFEKIRAGVGFGKLIGEMGDGTVLQPSEIRLLRSVLGDEIGDQIVELHGGIGGPIDTNIAKRALNEASSFTKSMMSSMDVSAPLRQGLPLIYRKEYWPAFKNMFSYLLHQDAYDGLMASISERKNFNLGENAGLHLTSISDNLNVREEAFMSQLADKVPGVKASERAYTGFLNKLRADTFDSLISDAEKMGHVLSDTSGNPTPVAKEIANFVNTSTGRGSLGRFEKNAVELNALLFSPRLISSRLTMLNPQYYLKASPMVRKEALKSLFSIAALGSTVGTLSSLAGATVETNPTSADFGKTKIGNTRLDPFAGFLQYIVPAAKLLRNQSTSTMSGKTTELGSSFVAPTKFSILDNLRRTKMAPVASFIEDYLRGKDASGKPFEANNAIATRIIPMLLQDIYALYKDDPNSLPLAIPASLGMGIQTYDQPSNQGQLKPLTQKPMKPLIPISH